MTTAPTSPGELNNGLKPHETYTHQHHWRSADDEADAAKLGMWLFLSTEILLFAGFFCAYAVFRALYPGTWVAASHHYLDWRIGAVNTIVLLISSFTIVMAIRGAQLNKQGMILINLLITNLCAIFFLVVKLWLEYLPKIKKGELPGANFDYGGHAYATAEHAAYTPTEHDHIFLSIYWIATATHGFHVLVGIIVITYAMIRTIKGHFGPKHYTFLENTGLYWHIVDVIWIFLFPLMYLV